MTLERLTRGDKRLLLACVAIAAISLFVGVKYYFHAFPEASIEFRVTRESSLPVAESFLARLRLDPAGYRHAAVFGFDDQQKTFLERELGVEVEPTAGDTVRLWRGTHRCAGRCRRRNRRPVNNKGGVVGFQHLLARTQGPDLRRAARRLAEEFLAAPWAARWRRRRSRGVEQKRPHHRHTIHRK